MNILFCYWSWMNPNLGGVQRVSDTLSRFLIKKGFNLFYLTFINKADDDYQFPAKTYHLPDPEFFSRTNLSYYHNLLKDLKIDIIINHDSSNHRSKLWLNTGDYQVNKISLFHSDPLNGINNQVRILQNIKNPFLKKAANGTLSRMIIKIKTFRRRKEINYLLKKSDKLVVLSEAFISQMEKILKIKSNRIEAISNPCITKEIALQKKQKQILFVSRMEILNKRPERILQVWRFLQDQFPDWELVFLGDGKDRIKIERMAKSMNLINVSFKGFVDPYPYYEKASVICMTSDHEGFGQVLIEGMQYGLVPITFNNWASLSDIIMDDVNGILVKTGDMKDYQSKLDKLLKNEKYRNELSANAKAAVMKFDIERIGDKWVNLFHSLKVVK